MLASLRVATTAQLARLLECSEAAASARLSRMKARGLVDRAPAVRDQPTTASITAAGLRALGRRSSTSELKRTLNAGAGANCRHEIGVAWLWLAARAGALGNVSEILTDPELRAHDAARRGGQQPLGVGTGTFDWRGHPRRHYPDLLLTKPDGRRIAVELELTRKSAGRLAQIMRGYASDASISAVLYVVPSRALGAVISEAAARAGAADLTRVRQLTRDQGRGAPVPPRRATQRQAQRLRGAGLAR